MRGNRLGRLQATVDAARQAGFVAVAANNHFVFSTPWLDGRTALAAVIERTGDMTLATTISLASLRGPVPLAKALAALDVLCAGRLVAGAAQALRSSTTTRSARRSTTGGSGLMSR
jgi:alkanesulfonate monooxygenase SsuD/methylene tetrahydromethanopterin reductase-like flavin-dependent oxidoreductase (luciferase family)